MDSAALKQAFALYPDVKLVILVHLYGTPAEMGEIKAICDKHGVALARETFDKYLLVDSISVRDRKTVLVMREWFGKL